MAKKKPANPNASTPETSLKSHEDQCSACHEMLVKIHDPAAAKCETAKRLIAAKKKLDILLGLAPGPDGTTARFGVAPYGGSNIIGTQIHQKLKDGDSTGEFCITVLVKLKAPKGAKVLNRLPDSVDGIPTDIVALGNGVQHAGEPVVGGGSTTGFEQGTVGAVVNFGDADQYILSNQHVLNPHFAFGLDQPVLNSAFTQIGTLTAWSESGDAELDAAIALITAPGAYSPLYNGLALDPNPMTETEVTAAAQASGGFLVKKFGQKTGMTTGVISSSTPFRDVSTNGVMLKQQWMIQSTSGNPFSLSGDSGSLIIGASNNRPVGLLWGGDSSTSLISYANRISIVQAVFGPMKFL